MEQEHRISYQAGITRTPSDFLCAEGELAECINLTTDHEELKPVVQPAQVMEYDRSGRKILYVHRYNGQKRYISVYRWDGTFPRGMHLNASLDWGVEEDGEYVNKGTFDVAIPWEAYDNPDYTPQITSIGKTLIVSSRTDIQYFLWKTNSYQSLGGLEYLEVEFWLEPDTGGSRVWNTGNGKGIIYEDGSDFANPPVKSQEDYNNLVIGIVEKNRKAIYRKTGFSQPFFARAALQLKDNSYIHVTQPVLLMPCVTNNSIARYYWGDNNLKIYTYYKLLHFKVKNDYSQWSDIIKNVVIFVSDEIGVHDLTIDQGYSNISKTAPNFSVDGIYRAVGQTTSELHTDTVTGGGGAPYTTYEALEKEDAGHILSSIKSTSIFYKICSVGIGEIDAKSTRNLIDKYTLENLSTQDRLEYDDYYSHCKMCADVIYAYNARLNLAKVHRGFFEGFDHFLGWDNASSNAYRAYVRIETETRDYWIAHDYETTSKQGVFFYYPDPRAKHVTIWKGSSLCVLDADLTEHPGLNGAYYLKGMPGTVDEGAVSVDQTKYHAYNDENDNYATEALPNYIITSDVYNPWVFRADGYNRVDVGEIIGLSTITHALSQGQFGGFPLLIFSDTGIWAMAVDNTGLYNTADPKSREVCTNPRTIIQTDGAVFFVSKKGLMVIDERGERCVSDRLNGSPLDIDTLSPLADDTDWEDIVEDCQVGSFDSFVNSPDVILAYDYSESRLLIMNFRCAMGYVYNIKDGTFSKTIFPSEIVSAINDYPDYLLQGADHYIYSLYHKDREEDVDTQQLAFMLTRPMKFGGPVSQASLRQLKNVGWWDETAGSCVKTKVYISPDCRTWYPITSRFGAAARFFRLALYIKMLPSERLSGTILTAQERRDNHIR